MREDDTMRTADLALSIPGTVFWDFDGTLVSRPSMWLRSALRAAAEIAPYRSLPVDDLAAALESGFPWHRPDLSHPELCNPEAWWVRIMGRIAKALHALGCTPEEARSISQSVRERVVDASQYQVFPDVDPALQRLADAGWIQAVFSNHIPELADLLRDLGLARYFARIYTSALVGYEKPHAGFLGRVLADGPWPGPIWIVGDSAEADCLPAAAHGCRAILVRSLDARYRPHVADLGQAVDLLVAGSTAREGQEDWS